MEPNDTEYLVLLTEGVNAQSKYDQERIHYTTYTQPYKRERGFLNSQPP